MKEKKISVVLNTFNAEKYLKEVLDALKDFDEIVICDMYSEDHTLEIASEYNAKIISHERCQICEPARNYAIQAASNPWILVVDADEIVTNELKNYLYAQLERENPPAAIRIPRKNFFMGRFMHCLYPDYVIRFARKDLIDWPSFIHAQPQIEGDIEIIPPHTGNLALIHLATNTIYNRLEKMNTYTDREVIRRGEKRYGYGMLLLKPFVRFFHIYIQKKGFRDGKEGFIYASLDAIYKFVALVKQEEKYNKNHR